MKRFRRYSRALNGIEVKRRWSIRQTSAATVAFTLGLIALAGCPASVSPVLSVTPAVLDFGSTGTSDSVAIFNAGAGTLSWTIQESVPWLTAETTSGDTSNQTSRVTFKVDRTGLAPGAFRGTVTIDSNGGTKAVPVAMRVPGTPKLEVTPTTLSLIGTQDSADVTLHNTGDDTLTWTLALTDPTNPGSKVTMPSFMTITPSSGSVPAGGSATVHVAIDSQAMGDTPPSLALVFQSNGGTQQVALNISTSPASELAVDPKTLDFGDQLSQLTFDVYNNGAAGSVLNFQLSTDRPDLILLNPTSGSSTGTSDTVKNKVTVSVTLDRAAIKGDTDGGNIFVTVPGAQPVKVVVTAKKAPIVFEGATNRARPPFIMRFVFLLRDSLGQAIDTNDPLVLKDLQTAFTISEDGVPIDTNETSLFVNNGQNLKYNVTLLLDYTGSMYNAGDSPGAAIAQMVSSAKGFIQDLPAPYRLSLMEYHERQETDRLIHGFSTERQPLIDALDAFTVPDAEHGASEVYDAIIDACQRLENEDVGVLPLDDADVRALVFISDGRDTSSIHTLDQTVKFAQDARVRLYPVGFGQGIDSSALIQLATDTGGHYYPAPTTQDLVNLLQHETGAATGAPGLITTELSRQVVLTYITLAQTGTHDYTIQVNYQGQQGSIERPGIYAYGGDVRAGQITLTTTGIEPDGTSEVYVRAEYVPRDITQLRFRFITNQSYTVNLAPNGLLKDWELVDEGGGIYTALTTGDHPLKYGDFGNLLLVRFSNVALQQFTLGFRVDNRILVNPPFTKYFQYPWSIAVSQNGSATASVTPILLSQGFDPDAPGAFDADKDGVPDFLDLNPTNPNLP